MDDYISREAAIDEATQEGAYGYISAEELGKLPAADVVARDCFNKILSENDVMREQLASIGKKPGDKMDDVRPVVHGEWVPDDREITVRCSECGCAEWYIVRGKFCSNCGAQMDGGEKI